MRHPLATALLLAAAPALAAVGDKVGPETCKACHPAAYDAWKASPHARALDALPERSRKDARCLACHAPDADDGLGGVSCEACHGPGRAYSAAYVMRDPELARLVGLVDPGEKACLACHGEATPSLVRFDYAKKLPLIAHGPAPGAARPASPAAPAPRAPARGGRE